MKTVPAIRGVYSDLVSLFTPLHEHVNTYFAETKHKRWHFESRIKSLESFALKIESGRYETPFDVDDFLACTLVVEHAGNIKSAIKIIKKRFKLVYRRPYNDKVTHKHSNSFPFDDLRLYLRWKDSSYSRPTDLPKLLFEVQIKTFLQHAWAISTHDLTYKSSRCAWALERIVYQIKAMLEHAEVSIVEAQNLSSCSILTKEDATTTAKNIIIDNVLSKFPENSLPANCRLLSQYIYDLLHAIDITVDELLHSLESETMDGRGFNTQHLSPYNIITQTLINCHYEKFALYQHKADCRFKVVIPAEVDIKQLKRGECKNAIFLEPIYKF